MPTNTLTDTHDELGDTVPTYVFDVALAESLLSSSGMVLAGCLAAMAAVRLLIGGGTVSLLVTAVLVSMTLVAAWGLLLAVSRLRRKEDRFVVDPLGLSRHQGTSVVHTRWTDIASVTHVGSNSGSRAARWNGTDYRCRIELRDGSVTVFDNYVVDAVSLGSEIARRSSV